MAKECPLWIEVYAAWALSGEAYSDASLISLQRLWTANLQEDIVRGCTTAAQTAQLDKDLMSMSFPAPPSPDEEGQVVDERPLH